MYDLSCPFCPYFILQTYKPTKELKKIVGAHLATKHRTEMETYFWLADKVSQEDEQ